MKILKVSNSKYEFHFNDGTVKVFNPEQYDEYVNYVHKIAEVLSQE